MILLKSILYEQLRNTQRLAYGVYEEESFKSSPSLHKVFVIKKHTEKHPESSGEKDDSKVWTVVWIKFPESELTSIKKEIQSHLWTGWDSMLWNGEKVFVVFHNGVATFTNDGTVISPIVKDWSGLKKLADSNGIDVPHLQKILPSYFKSPTN
jgi:hypothetical protein